MRAIILAAGRGERMRPLTDHTPKPLLDVRGQPLIRWHIQALAAAGVRDIVINCAWLADQFPAQLGDGSRYGVRLHYSDEQRDHGRALETAGGIAKALPLLCADGDEAFWVLSGDVFLPGLVLDAQAAQDFASSERLAHLWLVPNQAHHPRGDFGISPQGLALSGETVSPRYTWSCVGLFKRALFDGVAPDQPLPLRPCLERGIGAGRISASLYGGEWTDVGTPERLAAVNAPGANPATS